MYTKIQFIICLIVFSIFDYSCNKESSEPDDFDEGFIVYYSERDGNIDNITVLMAASAKKSEGLKIKWPDNSPKHFWVEGMDEANAFLEWEVHLKEKAEFHVDVLLSSVEGDKFELNVTNNKSTIPLTIGINGWDKIDAGLITLEKGVNTIRFIKKSDKSTASVKSIELIKQDQYNDYLKRVADFKADPSWLANAGYGLMFQYGSWTYPEKGDKKKTLDELSETFDIPSFINMVKETGASYVIWSLTWWEYTLMMPSSNIDRIIGNSNRTASTNFIGKLASELQKNNIRFMLYYHLGHASHLGEITDWWLAQQWPEEFAATGRGNRDVFFKNWMDVIKELGETLGTNLDGWWFDDGLVYYPAPFERMGEAARSGNPDRLVAYNPWICVRYTDFQDVYFGEGSHGEAVEGSAPAGGNGIFNSGSQKGLLQHSMFIMEDDWGIHNPNQKIITRINQVDLVNWINSASERSVPLSINLLMWEDGKVSETTLDILKELKKEFRK